MALPHPRSILRRIAGLAAVALLVLVAGSWWWPAVVRADTGTVTSFIDLVRASDVVALVVVKEAPPDAPSWTIEVQRGYRGAAPGLLTIEATPQDPDFRSGERWLILTSNLQTLDFRAGLYAFRVDPDGAVEAKDDVVDGPASLDDLEALFGPEATAASPATEVGGAVGASHESDDPGAAVRDALPFVALGFVLAVLAVFLTVAAVAGRHLAQARSR